MKHYTYIITMILFMSTVIFAVVNDDSLDSIETDLIIKLVTIGAGHDFTAWWGHTAIVVENQNTGESKFYNYGLFSFEEDNFFTNFAMGRLIFWVGAWRTANAMAYYRGLDRDIRVQVLNLSKQKRSEIKRFLENNVKPENRRYLYDHFYDNCSTRLRDIFVRITNGQLLKITKQPGRMTFRQHTRRHTYHNPIMDFILMFLMNDTIDKPILIENEMFLPSEMEMVLDNFRYFNEEGIEQNFVKSKYTYYASKTVPKVPEKAPIHWPYTLILGVVLGGISLLIVWIPNLKWRWRKNLFGIYNSVIGLCFGFIGTVLFFMSVITDHIVTYYNENLFLANPLTLLIFPLGILVSMGKLKNVNWLYYTWLILFLFGVSGFLLKLVPAFDQDNWQAMTMILPIITAFALSSYLWKNKAHNSSE